MPFGKYLLLERVNVGGMAEVFVAKAFGVEGFERILAIKKILPTMVEDEEFITMFIDEARIAVQLNHANIVQIYELGKHDENYYIAMEYVSGRDLRLLLDRYRRRGEIMPTAQAVYVVSKICEGLDYAHRKKDARGADLHIVHRDVSPQNILISYDGDIKLIDFGIAKAANRAQKTQAGILKGKFGYMSPEQVRGLPIDRRSDIFAVGVILYECLTGEKLFVGESDFSTLEKVRNADVTPPREFNDQIPPGLEKVVLRSLAREPEERYQYASDLQEDLMRFLLAGDTVFSSKHLGSYMRDAFGDDVKRESSRMEQWLAVARPDDVESSVVTATPTPSPLAAPPRAPKIDPVHAAAIAAGHDLDDLEPEPEDRTEIFRPSFDGARPAPSEASDVSPAPAPLPERTVVAAAADVEAADEGTGRVTQPLAPPPGRDFADDEDDDEPGLDRAAGERTSIRIAAPPPRKPERNGHLPPPPPPRDAIEEETDDELLDGAADDRDADDGYEEDELTDPPAPPPRLVPQAAPRAPASPAIKVAVLAGVAAFVAVLGVIGVWAAFFRGPGTAGGAATLVVLTEPADAPVTSVRIDGKEVSKQAPYAAPFPPGPHAITIVTPAGERTREVELAGGEQLKVVIQLPVAEARPAVAAAEPKPEPKAEEPKPEEPKPDEAAAAAAAPEVPVEAAAAAEPKLDGAGAGAAASAASAKLAAKITTEPPGATVKLDGKKVGETPYAFEAEPGQGYDVELVGPSGYDAAKLRHTFVEGDLTLAVQLPEKRQPVAKKPPEKSDRPSSKPAGGRTASASASKKKGYLILNSKPTAQVFVNGKNTGQWTPIPPARKLELPVGSHKITFKTQDGKKVDRTVTIKEGETAKLIGVEL